MTIKPGVGVFRNIESVGIGDNARAITGLVLVLSDRVGIPVRKDWAWRVRQTI